MHSYGKIIVDVNTTTTLDLNADLSVDLHADLYGPITMQISVAM